MTSLSCVHVLVEVSRFLATQLCVPIAFLTYLIPTQIGMFTKSFIYFYSSIIPIRVCMCVCVYVSNIYLHAG